MKIITYNVNGLRAAVNKGLPEWLAEENPDVLCLQETKLQPEQYPAESFEDNGALLQLLEHIVGDSLVDGNSVLNGEAVDALEFDLTAVNVALEQKFEHSCGLARDDGAYAVAAANADSQLIEL